MSVVVLIRNSLSKCHDYCQGTQDFPYSFWGILESRRLSTRLIALQKKETRLTRPTEQLFFEKFKNLL